VVLLGGRSHIQLLPRGRNLLLALGSGPVTVDTLQFLAVLAVFYLLFIAGAAWWVR
jgi:hypothetical protein